MIDNLASLGLKRLTITGGEPTILGDELFDFINYIHNKRVHTCLSTTGYLLTHAQITKLDKCLDHLLISIRFLNRDIWIGDFGDAKPAGELFDTVLGILQWVKDTEIILEVNTAVSKDTLASVIDLGYQLVELNPNIVWRLDEYYATGIHGDRRDEFEILDQEYEQIREEVTRKFGGLFRGLRFSTKQQRSHSPEYLIAHTGELFTSSDHTHTSTAFNAVHGPFPETFGNMRSWESHQLVCRNWGWEDN